MSSITDESPQHSSSVTPAVLVLLAIGTITSVTMVTTFGRGLDLWSGHVRHLPCLWTESKGVLRICGDSGDGHDAHDGPLRAYSK